MKESAYRGYLLAALMLILAANFLDRLALGVLLQDIKLDLQLSDTQVGLLTGLAFALFYSIMGIHIARWADRGNRVLIIALTTALWSAAVALCGMASSFLQLLVIRIGVAVGEAGCIPPAHSLIADYYRRAERPRAVAIYMLGGPLSMIIGYFFAGLLNEIYGWRTTFVLLGLPGLALAAIAWFTLREPRRELWKAQAGCQPHASHGASAPAATAAAQPTLREVWVTLTSNRTFVHLLLGYAVISFFGMGISQWKPAFFIRSYGLQTAELGAWFAAIYGVGGLLGTYLGGALASRHAAHNERLQLRAMAVAYCGFGVVSAGIYLSRDQYVAFGLMGLATLGGYATIGPLFATIQTLVPDRVRALAIAIVYLVANLVGAGLGPLVVGIMSDALRPLVAEESLRYALLAMCPGYLWCAWQLWRGSKTVEVDLQAFRGERGGARDDPEVSAAATSNVSRAQVRNVARG